MTTQTPKIWFPTVNWPSSVFRTKSSNTPLKTTLSDDELLYQYLCYKCFPWLLLLSLVRFVLIYHEPSTTPAEVFVAWSYFTLSHGPKSHFTSVSHLEPVFTASVSSTVIKENMLRFTLWFSILVQYWGKESTRFSSLTEGSTLGSWLPRSHLVRRVHRGGPPAQPHP